MAQDKGKALKCYLKAAEWGHPDGFLKCWELAGQGNVKAMCQVGYCYMYREGIRTSERKAVEWYMKAAEAGSAEVFGKCNILAGCGNAEAMFFVGKCCEEGKFAGPQNEKVLKRQKKKAME